MISTRGMATVFRTIGDNLVRPGQPSFLSLCKPMLRISSSNFCLTSGRYSDQQTEDASDNRQVQNDPKTTDTTGGFAKAFDNYAGQQSFVKLLRNSPLIRMGDPVGKVVEGIVYHAIEDDLYIDFGGKFHCVCVRPLKNPEMYHVGTKVRILLHDLELSTRFLGAATDLTILEADATLLGLASSKMTEKSVTEELLST